MRASFILASGASGRRSRMHERRMPGNGASGARRNRWRLEFADRPDILATTCRKICAVMPADQSPSHAPSRAHRGSVAALTVAATGIVYGDIGTSPLYALDQI